MSGLGTPEGAARLTTMSCLTLVLVLVLFGVLFLTTMSCLTLVLVLALVGVLFLYIG